MPYSRLPLAALVAVALAGCVSATGRVSAPAGPPAPHASTAPAASTPTAPSASAQPIALGSPDTTHATVRGQVVAAGTADGLPGVVVHVGDQDVVTAMVDGPGVPAAQEFDADHASLARLVVLHDFGDQRGPVPAVRVLRHHPAGTGQAAGFAYLHSGEFLAEDVPPGAVTVTAAQGELASDPVTVTAVAGQETAGVRPSLPVIRSQAIADGRPAHTVMLLDTSPATFTVNTDLTTVPSPPTMTFKLAAPAGSAGAMVAGVDVTIGHAPTDHIPIAPVAIAPGQPWGHGAVVTLALPLDVGTAIQQLFPAGAAATANLMATIQFTDDAGFVVQGPDFHPLQAEVGLHAR